MSVATDWSVRPYLGLAFSVAFNRSGPSSPGWRSAGGRTRGSTATAHVAHRHPQAAAVINEAGRGRAAEAIHLVRGVIAHKTGDAANYALMKGKASPCLAPAEASRPCDMYVFIT